MPGGLRSLPGHPSLRHLRLEAKRRLAAGEFPALHDAQAAIAREHGLPNWAALKQHVTAAQEPDQSRSHALDQLYWMFARFADAGSPGWTAPDDAEMREHVDDRFLAAVPVSRLVEAATQMAGDLRGELLIIAQSPFEAQVQLSGLRYLAAVDAEPPHRLLGLQGFPIAERLADPRLTTPQSQRAPQAQPALCALADEAAAELGLPALIVAGGDPGTPPWVLARGRPDLDRPEALTPSHRFPAPGISALVTATAVLRLIGQGRLTLDTPANDLLRTVRLENNAYAVLGQLIEDVTGAPFADAVTRLVLNPLKMRDSAFPRHSPQSHASQSAVTTYHVTPEGTFAPAPSICTVQAVAGLWSTGADLVRLGTGWPSLLPAALAREALTPQSELPAGTHAVGLSWLLDTSDTTVPIAVHQGMGADSAATLVLRIRDYRTHVVLTNRQMTLNSLNSRLRRNWTAN